ncbi:MAG: hypothetical protein QM775_08055 [Pirellulales bacterium]
MTNTSTTTPGSCEPTEMFSVCGSTIPVPATVCENGARGGCAGGGGSLSGCCAFIT